MKQKAMSIAVFIFISFIGHILALKCFQGAINTSNGTIGAATTCPNSDDIACAMSHNSSTKFASFMCSKLNCTVNGEFTHESVCVNASVFQKNCCCYTDGCSSTFLMDSKNISLSPSSVTTLNMTLTTPKPSVIMANVTSGSNITTTNTNSTTPKPSVFLLSETNATSNTTTAKPSILSSNVTNAISNINVTTPKPSIFLLSETNATSNMTTPKPSILLANVTNGGSNITTANITAPMPSSLLMTNVTNGASNTSTNATSNMTLTTPKPSIVLANVTIGPNITTTNTNSTTPKPSIFLLSETNATSNTTTPKPLLLLTNVTNGVLNVTIANITTPMPSSLLMTNVTNGATNTSTNATSNMAFTTPKPSLILANVTNGPNITTTNTNSTTQKPSIFLLTETNATSNTTTAKPSVLLANVTNGTNVITLNTNSTTPKPSIFLLNETNSLSNTSTTSNMTTPKPSIILANVTNGTSNMTTPSTFSANVTNVVLNSQNVTTSNMTLTTPKPSSSILVNATNGVSNITTSNTTSPMPSSLLMTNVTNAISNLTLTTPKPAALLSNVTNGFNITTSNTNSTSAKPSIFVLNETNSLSNMTTPKPSILLLNVTNSISNISTNVTSNLTTAKPLMILETNSVSNVSTNATSSITTPKPSVLSANVTTGSNITAINTNSITPKPVIFLLNETNSLPNISTNATTNMTTPKPSIILANVTNGTLNTSTNATSNTGMMTPKISSSPLKCVQGLWDTTGPLSLTATTCTDPTAATCQMKYNSFGKSASFSCSLFNCTINGVTIRDASCVNVSTVQKNCCCYGDDCTTTFYSDLKGDLLSNLTTSKIVVTTPQTSLIVTNVTKGVNISDFITPIPPSPSNSTTPKPSSSVLKCLQGTTNTTLPINIAPTTCLNPLAVTCLIQHDSASKLALFACSNSSCSLNGQTSPNTLCVNITTTQKNCCCYGDGCNTLSLINPSTNSSATSIMNLTTPQPSSVIQTNVTKSENSNTSTSNTTNTTPKASTSTPLKCLQGSINTSIPLSTAPTFCADPYAVTCRTQHDPLNKFANFSCSSSSCTVNGLSVQSPVCVNVSASLNNCCCYGDSCNTALFNSNQPMNSSINTNKTATSAAATSKDQIKCDESGFKTLSTAVDPPLTKGKFAGYLTYRSSCQQLCDKSYGLIKCVAYMYEPNNRGKCTIFQQPIDEEIVEHPGSNVVVSAKC